MTRALRLLVTLGCAGAPALGNEPDGGARSSRAALVRFHTACASCHASECSGRLSFQSGTKAAAGHVKRYVPSADDALVRELFVMLTTLKRTCRAELPRLEQPRARWTAEQLREWFNPDGDAYFIPLGELAAPGVTVELDPGAVKQGTLQVLDDALETVAEAPLGGEALRVDVRVERKTECFLLVRGARGLASLRVTAGR